MYISAVKIENHLRNKVLSISWPRFGGVNGPPGIPGSIVPAKYRHSCRQTLPPLTSFACRLLWLAKLNLKSESNSECFLIENKIHCEIQFCFLWYSIDIYFHLPFIFEIQIDGGYKSYNHKSGRPIRKSQCKRKSDQTAVSRILEAADFSYCRALVSCFWFCIPITS